METNGYYNMFLTDRVIVLVRRILSGKELDAAKKAMLKVSKKHKECLEDKTKIEKEERVSRVFIQYLAMKKVF